MAISRRKSGTVQKGERVGRQGRAAPGGLTQALRISRSAIGLAVLCVSLAVLGLNASSAFAERTYDSQITGFSNPWGVTIDSADNVWVSDPGDGGLISEFSSYRQPGLHTNRWGAFSGGGGYIRSLAVDGSNDDLYVADSETSSSTSSTTTGPFSGQLSHGFGGGFLYVAADNSGGPSDGRVYVASRTAWSKPSTPAATRSTSPARLATSTAMRSPVRQAALCHPGTSPSTTKATFTSSIWATTSSTSSTRKRIFVQEFTAPACPRLLRHPDRCRRRPH